MVATINREGRLEEGELGLGGGAKMSSRCRCEGEEEQTGELATGAG